MEDLRPHAQGLGKSLGPGRQDHELLDVDRVVRMGAAIDDVHHRQGQDAGRDPAHILVERQVRRDRRGLGRRKTDAQDGVGAQPALVGRAVQFDQHAVQPPLVLRVETGQGVEDLAVDRVHRQGHALAAIALRIAIALFHRLVRPGGGARRHGGAAEGAVFQGHVHLDRRIAAAVQDLAGDDVDDLGHDLPYCLAAARRGGFSPRATGQATTLT